MEVKGKRGRPNKTEEKAGDEALSKILATVSEEKVELPEKAEPTNPFEHLDPKTVKVSVTSIDTTSPNYDPFEKYKTEPEKYYYRALNVRPNIMSKREAQGYEIVPEAKQYGDLKLARMPWELRNQRVKKVEDKTKKLTESTVEQFREQATRHGYKTFEKGITKDKED